ncbi:MAG: oligosaccharide flippase family protein [Nitrospira sp.]|nr:oligosaccharide flippase family protein [Nitrospira sp.]MDH4242190.1 oligosaccharide flippase family protein [Nitrospira sp.]MDH4357032.1 oligosaccharide flippase family protein [Nitrospira sp.]MDH5317586.1 oligosaccharide flippase family protein [Nitrospira sp.]
MLLRHIAYYSLARGLPGVVNFAALAVYTRLLSPDEFGRYAVVLAGVGLVNVIVFQWLRLVLLRFLHANTHDSARFLSGILALFLTLALAVTGVGALLVLWWPDPVWQHLLALAVPLLLAQAWFELNLELVRARLAPLVYGKLLGSKAVIALALGALLAWIGLGTIAPLLGLIVSHALALLVFGLGAWNAVRPAWPGAQALREQLRYGLPLMVSFALVWVVSSSDRLLLAWFLDEAAVGAYAAGYDLAFQVITLLLVIINTAAHPLAINALENQGPAAATEQLRINGELIFVAALTAAAVLFVLSPVLVPWLIGVSFRDDALRILPWIVLASALAGIKAYFFDMAFHLGRRSGWLVITGGLAALANVGLNLVLIPRYGITGAAAATLAAYGSAMVASAWFGARVFPMPSTQPLLAKALVIALLTGVVSHWLLPDGLAALSQLAMGAVLALVVALVLALSLNVANARHRMMECLCKF